MERRNFLKLSAVAVSTLPANLHMESINGNTVTSNVKEVLVNLEKQAWQAWRNRDTTFLLNFFSEGSIIVGPAGVFGRGAIQELAQTDSPGSDFVLDNFQMVKLDDNTAVLTFRALQNITGDSDSQLSPTWASTVYVKRQNKWAAAFHQQTAAAQDKEV